MDEQSANKFSLYDLENNRYKITKFKNIEHIDVVLWFYQIPDRDFKIVFICEILFCDGSFPLLKKKTKEI